MFTYLALGDSYTIGELVSRAESFPFQLQKLLAQSSIFIENPHIIATTGWTTDELMEGIAKESLMPPYNIVTLLIGVNNQYRGRSIENYKKDFSTLLNQALSFVNGNTARVFVLSIPDWSQTPFAAEKNIQAEEVKKQIDSFNYACKAITLKNRMSFIDVTESTRQHASSPEFLASDKLHPSGKEYEIWAQMLMPLIREALTKDTGLS